ncbi:MAG: type 2 lanthipeptide synthetase LanM [Acidobacteriota bacterium]
MSTHSTATTTAVEIDTNLVDGKLVDLVERASSLPERLGKEYRPRAASTRATQRLERWRRQCGTEEGFVRRLEVFGLDLDGARAVLGDVEWIGTELPSWSGVIQQALAVVDASPASRWTADACLDSERPLPFDQLLVPFVAVARQRLATRALDKLDVLSTRAMLDLERRLLEDLVNQAAETLMIELDVERTNPLAGGFSMLRGSMAAGSTEVFDRLVARFWSGDWRQWLWRYPMLARRLSTYTMDWVDAVASFVDHVHADREALAEMFGVTVDVGSIESIGSGLSDPHRGRRTVYRVHFRGRVEGTDDVEIIYKPRSLEAEVALGVLLDEMGETPHPRRTRAFDRGDHGWVEPVRHQPVDDDEAAARYFRRAGALIAIVYALGGTDGHNGNLIASSEDPVLIDLETLAHARMRPSDGVEPGNQGSLAATWSLHWQSVFRTGFLPQWDLGPNGESFDISGLGGVGGHRTHITQRVFRHVNTDGMAVALETIETGKGPNRVELDGELVDPGGHLESICDGFAAAYAWLCGARDASSTALDGLAEGSFRLIYRHTRVYQLVTRELRRATNLGAGIDASLTLERLILPLRDEGPTSPYWDLVAAEQDDLLRGDVPMFTAVRGSADLHAGGERCIRDVLEADSSRLGTTLGQLDDDDCDYQLQLIRTAFGIRRASATGVVTAPPALDQASATRLDTADLATEVGRIADQLANAALGSRAGSLSWIGLLYHPDSGRWRMEVTSPRLYDGNGGIALFFAAVGRAVKLGLPVGFDATVARDLTRAALRGPRDMLDHPSFRRGLYEPGIGAGFGPASLVLAALIAGRMLDDDELITLARHYADDLLTPEVLDADTRLDVLNGVAGAAVALLRLWRVTGEARYRDLALRAAERLRDTAVDTDNHGRAWPTLERELITGFGHGSAGIAWSLWELYGDTGERWLKELAVAARRFEATTWDAEQGNWRMSGSPGRQAKAFRSAWCHGAPGMSLARLAAVDHDDGAALAELELALGTTNRDTNHHLDHLCCGSLGQAEVLHRAGRQLDRDDWLDQAHRRAAAVVARARARTDRYALGWDDLDLVPALHQGLAGIGHQLLRFAAPEHIPSILTWELPE